jgi:hypothetical protein
LNEMKYYFTRYSNEWKAEDILSKFPILLYYSNFENHYSHS